MMHYHQIGFFGGFALASGGWSKHIELCMPHDAVSGLLRKSEWMGMASGDERMDDRKSSRLSMNCSSDREQVHMSLQTAVNVQSPLASVDSRLPSTMHQHSLTASTVRQAASSYANVARLLMAGFSSAAHSTSAGIDALSASR